MSRTLKIVLIVASITVAAGILVAGGGFIYTAKNKTGSDNYSAQSKSFSTGLNKILVNVDEGDIIFKVGEVDNIKVDYRDNNDKSFSFDEVEGTLEISRDSEPFFFNFYKLFNYDQSIYDVKITLPKSYYGSIGVSTRSGDVSVSGVCTKGDIDLDSTSGEIVLSDIECGRILSESTSGDTDFNRIKANGNITVDSTSGDIEGNKIECADLKTNSTSGDTDIYSLFAANLDVKSTSGEVDLSGIEIKKSILINSTSGDVNASVTDGIEKYTISCDTGSGNSNLPDKLEGGSKELNVDTGSGDVRFSFNGGNLND